MVMHSHRALVIYDGCLSHSHPPFASLLFGRCAYPNLSLTLFSFFPLSDRYRVGRQRANVQKLRRPDGAHGRDGGHAEVGQRAQRHRHRCVGRPHQRHCRHLRYSDRLRRRVHPLPPAAQPASAPRSVECPHPPPLESCGRDALPRCPVSL